MNRLAWSILRRVAARTFRDKVINEERGRRGQLPLRCNAGWAWLESDATVVLVSNHYYGDGAPDWPTVTWGGFSVWHGPEGVILDPDLDRYVEAGDPPVLVMLGTSAATDAGSQFARIASDLDRHGLRSVLLVGDPANLRSVASRPGAALFAPVTELLPRCQVAVISGALGGVAAALTAAIPVVIHPQLFDQVWHGRRVEELGVGRMARRTSQVADAVRRIADDPGYAQRARALAVQMAGEDGATAVAASIERLVAS